MEQKSKISSAALNGLILGAVTIVYSLIVTLVEPKGFLSIILWTIKFAATNYLLYYLIKEFAKPYNYIKYGECFSYGVLVSSFSAIICACFSFISMAFLFPDQTDMIIEQVQTAMGSQSNITEEQEAMFDKLLPRLPELTLFFSLIYYTIYGVIASSIIANFTKKTDPFATENTLETPENN